MSTRIANGDTRSEERRIGDLWIGDLWIGYVLYEGEKRERREGGGEAEKEGRRNERI